MDTSLDSKNLAKSLREGGFAVLPTDTVYGIHTSALRPHAVEGIYKIKGRPADKPFIILLAHLHDLKVFKIKLSNKVHQKLEKIWPGKVSVLVPCKEPVFDYLHKGTNKLAFRIPQRPDLRRLLEQTGPLVSTSVNKSNQKPANSIAEAKSMFGDLIDFYVDEGPLHTKPSTLIEIKEDKIKILRQGEVKLTS